MNVPLFLPAQHLPLFIQRCLLLREFFGIQFKYFREMREGKGLYFRILFDSFHVLGGWLEPSSEYKGAFELVRGETTSLIFVEFGKDRLGRETRVHF